VRTGGREPVESGDQQRDSDKLGACFVPFWPLDWTWASACIWPSAASSCCLDLRPCLVDPKIKKKLRFLVTSNLTAYA